MFKIKFKDGTVKEFESLVGRDLRGSDLRGADLSESDLRRADLSESDLSGSDLWGSDLRGANLRFVNLSGVDLRYANLRGADLRFADLSESDLRFADLSGASLDHCRGVISFCIEKNLAIYYKVKGEYYLSIGCKSHSLDYWLKNYRNIGESAQYSSDEVDVYGEFIRLCAKFDIT